MKRSKLFWLALLLLPLPLVPVAVRNVRSVIPYSAKPSATSAPFDPAQSVALFVGVPRFTHDSSLTEVRFAVDDAVDLAYAFTLGANAALVPVKRTVIAISGLPHKKESKVRLDALKAAGATVVSTTDQPDLLQLLRQQAELGGPNGLFVASFATHGFTSEGVPHLLGRSSLFRDLETTLSTAKIADIVGQSDAARSLLFIDACRDRVNRDARAGSQEPLSAAPLLSAMNKVAGQVIFYAAPAGGYAYDDEKRGNGVFTAAVIDSMQCPPGQKRTYITVRQLADDVEKRVRKWVRINKKSSLLKATQISTEGSTDRMPLALCRAPSPGFAELTARSLTAVRFEGAMIDALDENGRVLWRNAAAGAIRKAIVGKLFHTRTTHVVVISDDERGAASSLLSIYDGTGKRIVTYRHPGPMQYVEIARRTWRHNATIIVSATNADRGAIATLFMLDPARMKRELWYGAMQPARQRIDRLDITDYDDDGDRDIAISTSAGNILHLDFEGHLLGYDGPRDRLAQFTLLARK
jgi:hypothetical protein